MLFQHLHRTATDSRAKRRFYAMVEIVYTVVDFSAASCFIVGSVMFLWADWQTPATWFFIVGSILFAMKPVIRLGRELKLAAMGDDIDLAKRAGIDPKDLED